MRLSRPQGLGRGGGLGRALVAVAAAAVASCGSGGGEGAVDPGEAPPSLILVSLDTLRPDHLGLYGYERDTSPYLDRLASECLVFDRAYTTAAWTLVAHMSMLTGLEASDHGVTGPTKALSPEVPPVAERLRERGYRTLGLYAGECKWVEPRYGFGRGFELYQGHDGPEDARARLAAALADHHPSRPLFLFLHLFDVHSAPFEPGFTGFYDPPPPFDEMFLPGARELLADVDCLEVWDGDGTLPPDQLEAMRALYDGGVRYVDSELETLVEGWRASGLLDRALLVITADHGESLGAHGRAGGHGGMYEEGLRIPLLVRFPDGHRAGEREEGLVSVVDFATTFLEAAGLEVEPWRAGRSLRTPPPAERVVRAQRALIGSRWKVNQEVGQRSLYDLVEDAAEAAPRETVAGEAREQAMDLRRRYEEERRVRARPRPARWSS